MEWLEKLPLDSLPFEVNAMTIAMAAIVLLFLLISIIKGIIKTIMTLLQICVVLVAFIFGYIRLTPYVEPVFPDVPEWLPLTVAVISAVVAFTIYHILIGILTGKKNKSPVSGGNSGGKKRSFNPLRPLSGLIIGMLALFGAMTLLRYFGTHAELKHLQTLVSAEDETTQGTPLLVQAKQWLDQSSLAQWQEKFDALNTIDYRSRLNLAKLIILSEDEKELTSALLKEENTGIIKAPEITELTISADDLRKFCTKHNFTKLYQDERFIRIAKKPSTRSELIKLKLDDLFNEKDAEEKP